MTGLNRKTGQLVTGWPHVVQSLEVIFTTRLNERVMRRWVGSIVPALLGENLTEPVVLAFYTAVASTIEVWEPRFAIKQIRPLLTSAGARNGSAGFEISGAYRPNALNGDYTETKAVKVTVSGTTGAVA